MTDAAIMAESMLPPSGPARDPEAESRPRSYLATVARETVRAWGARLGLVWLAALVFLAVFGPLLASSHPYLMRTAGGEVSSPLLEHLGPADVTLFLFALLAAGLLLVRRWPARLRWGLALAGLGLTIGLSVVLVQPSRAVVFDRYRTMLASEEIEWAVFPPIAFSPNDRLRDMPELTHPMAPSWAHPLGTDNQGEDVASQMIHASRIAIAVGFIATGIALVIGVVIGGLMGFFSGWVDLLGMRLVEVFSAIPTFFLLLAFVAFYGRNLYLMMVIIGITGWVGYCRFIRAEFLKLRQQDFVQAARACGIPLRSILFRHMLPNGVAPVLVEASFGVAAAILYESTLSFLGLGLVDEPSWGQLLSDAAGQGGGFYWWIATFPGLAIFLTVFAFNLIGESLRDAIDPHTKKAAAL